MRSAGRRRRWASEGRQQRQTPYRGPRNIQSPPEGWSGNRLEGCSSIHYRRSTLVCQVNNYPVQRTRPAVRDGGRRDANRLAHHWGHTAVAEGREHVRGRNDRGYKICIASDLVINTLWAWRSEEHTSELQSLRH